MFLLIGWYSLSHWKSASTLSEAETFGSKIPSVTTCRWKQQKLVILKIELKHNWTYQMYTFLQACVKLSFSLSKLLPS